MLRFILLLTSAAVFGATVPDRYILELAGEPSGGIKAGRLAAIRDQHSKVRAAARQAGAEVLDTLENVANAVVVRSTDPDRLRQIPGVVAVHPVPIYKPLLDRAVLLQKVTDAWAAIGGQANAGRGIKIGIIDTGIQMTHAAFQDNSLPELDGFPKVNQSTDSTLTNRKVVVARNYGSGLGAGSANDTKGHGTAVAMVAAGVTNTGPFGAITGIAPKAYLGNYKVFPDDEEGAPLDLVLRALEDAVADGMDIVNLSLGGQPARRSEEDFFVRAVERAISSGVIVVVAAGNEGPDLNTIASPATAPNAISVGSARNDRVFAASVRVDSTQQAFIAALGNGAQPAQPVTGALDDVARLDPTGLACSALDSQSLQGRIALILRGTCTFEEKLNNAQGAGAIGAVIYTNDRPVSSMDVASARLPAMMVANTDGLALKQQIESGIEVTMNFRQTAVGVDPNGVSSLSSRGPSSSGGIKPDLLGVGSNVSTAAAGELSSNGYSVESGTSLSSPMVAGAAALLKAARPGLSSDQYRSLLVNSAADFIGTVQQTGGGLLDMSASLRSTVAASPVSLSFGIGGDTVNAVRTLRVTNLGAQTDTFSLTPVSAMGLTPSLSTTSLTLDAGQSAEVEVRLDGSQSGQSLGTVQIRGTQSDVGTHVPFWYATPSNRTEAITILEAAGSAPRNTSTGVRFRITDASGVPVTEKPEVTAVEGNGRVRSVDSIDSEYPGVWSLSVQLGPVAGINTYRIGSGGHTLDFSITGR